MTQNINFACQNLVKKFGKFTAVNDVSFDVPEGSFFSILGPSGCGKTTIMRMIAGFENPNSGDIILKNKSVVNIPPNRRNVKMVFQHLALFPMMTVGENIAYGLRCQGQNRADIAKKTREVLNRINLPGTESKQISQLSGGQKQRIAIARCMVLEPDLLLLDEPLGALDLKLRETMKIELKLLQKMFGTTFIYITHDQSEALVMSNKIAVMAGGKFEQIGSPEALYHQPKSQFVASFVGDSNKLSGKFIDRSKDQVKIELEDGSSIVTRFADSSEQSPNIGQKMVIYIRPEFLNVHFNPPKLQLNNHNVIAGKFENKIFNGSNSRLLMRFSGNLVEASHLPSGVDDHLNHGDHHDVFLSFDTDKALSYVDPS